MKNYISHGLIRVARQGVCVVISLLLAGQNVLANISQSNVWMERAEMRLPSVPAPFFAGHKPLPITAPAQDVSSPSGNIPKGLLKYVKVRDAQIEEGRPLVYLLQDIH